MANQILPPAPTGLHKPARPTPPEPPSTTRRLDVVQQLTVQETTSSTPFRDPGFDVEAVDPAPDDQQAVTPTAAMSTIRVWSLVFAWWWSLLMAPLFTVLAMIGLIHPPAAHMVVIGAIAIGLGASIAALTLLDDAITAITAVTRPATTHRRPLPVGCAEDGRQGRPQAARSGLMSENTTPTTPLANTQPQTDRQNGAPLVPRYLGNLRNLPSYRRSQQVTKNDG